METCDNKSLKEICWRLVIPRNDFHQGVPTIFVIYDELYLGQRPESCYILVLVFVTHIFTSVQQLNTGIVNLGPTSASGIGMLAPRTGGGGWGYVLVQGFCRAEKTSGVRYMRLIADGDSSVYARIQEQVAKYPSGDQRSQI